MIRLIFMPALLYKQPKPFAVAIRHRALYSRSDLRIDKFAKELADESRLKIGIDSPSQRTRLLLKPIVHVRGFVAILNELENNAIDNHFFQCYMRAIVSASHVNMNSPLEFNPGVLRAIGTRMMQYFHLHGNEKLALTFYNDHRLKCLFYMEFNCQIFMDLLYKKKRYGTVIKCFKEIYSKHILPSNRVIHLLVAACCKTVYSAPTKWPMTRSYDFGRIVYLQNTHASLKLAQSVMEQQPRKNLMIYSWNVLALLALNLKDPHMAYSILTTSYNDRKRSCLNLMLLTLARIRRFDQILPIVASGKNRAQPNIFSEEVVSTSPTPSHSLHRLTFRLFISDERSRGDPEVAWSADDIQRIQGGAHANARLRIHFVRNPRANCI